MPVYKAEIEITADAFVEADTPEEAKAIFDKARKDLSLAFDLTPEIAASGFFFMKSEVEEN